MGHMKRSLKLKVRSAESEDVYKDIVRISEVTRDGLKTGRVHKFSVPEGTAYFILRGTGPEHDGKLLIDEAARGKLGLSAGVERDFRIEEAGFWGELRWMWNATDPTYRIAGRLGVLSFALGLIALVPLVIDLAKWLSSICAE
jgi:hypothetical protein